MTMQILNEAGFGDFLQTRLLCAVYYSGPDCNVCKVLKPRLLDMLQQDFPRLLLGEVDCSTEKGLAAGQGVFAIPTLIIYSEGREAFRFSRSFSPAQVAGALHRPYGIMMGD
jgi:thioredoxin 1